MLKEPIRYRYNFARKEGEGVYQEGELSVDFVVTGENNGLAVWVERKNNSGHAIRTDFIRFFPTFDNNDKVFTEVIDFVTEKRHNPVEFLETGEIPYN